MTNVLPLFTATLLAFSVTRSEDGADAVGCSATPVTVIVAMVAVAAVLVLVPSVAVAVKLSVS
jgi:uncharacterized membrane protein YhaH (DUF805 family)